MKNKVLFVHIPKTAGTSLRQAFASIGTISPHFNAFHRHDAPFTEDTVLGHISWADAVRHYSDRSFFTFLREPIDRAMSWCAFTRSLYNDDTAIPTREIRGENTTLEAINLAGRLSLRELIECGHPHVTQCLSNRQTWQLSDEILPERRTIAETDALKTAIHNLKRFEFVGLVEHFPEDYPRLAQGLGIRKHLPNLHKTTVEREPLTDDVRGALTKMNALDLALYQHVAKANKVSIF